MECTAPSRFAIQGNAVCFRIGPASGCGVQAQPNKESILTPFRQSTVQCTGQRAVSLRPVQGNIAPLDWIPSPSRTSEARGLLECGGRVRVVDERTHGRSSKPHAGGLVALRATERAPRAGERPQRRAGQGARTVAEPAADCEEGGGPSSSLEESSTYSGPDMAASLTVCW